MKLKNLLVLILTAFLYSSLYAQEVNPEMHIFNDLKILDEPSSMPLNSDNKGTQESSIDNFVLSVPATLDSNLAQLLQDVLDTAIIKYNIKGLSAALSTPNGDIWKGASGISYDTVEVTTDMLFGIASITKTFMATIIMQLYEADSLKLSDSIYKWLPPFDNIDSTVTIKQLLNHTSGIYNVTDHPGYIDSVFVAGSRIWTPEEVLETFVLAPSFLPGTDYEYSNTNFKLLGMIIEEITGNEVVSELHNRLTIPLELNSTFLFPDEGYEGIRSHVWYPVGTNYLDVTDLVDTTAFSAAWTSGGILSTAEDLVKWSKGLYEGEILNDTTLALMKVPGPYSNGFYGLGTSIRYLYQLPIYGHSGNYIYRSQLFYVPFDSLSISVLSNQQLPSIASVWNDLYFAYKDFISSQVCLAEGITFTTQEEIDNFQNNHPNCSEIEGNVTVAGDDITNLNGLSVLNQIGGDLVIGDFEGGITNLTNMTGLENLTSVGGSLVIGALWAGNPNLLSLTGLENVTSIGGDLSIGYNEILTSITGLEGLTSIGGILQVGSNGSLTSLAGLEGLSAIEEDLSIGANSSLTSLAGLDNIATIGGNFNLANNQNLESLTGLDNVTSIGGNLAIEGNGSLTSLTSFDNLTSIGGDLFINYNNALTSLSGMDNIDASSIANLSFSYNQSLSSCDVQSICDYLSSPNPTVDIHDNALGCNGQDEVEEACLVSATEELIAIENYSIHPNPVTDIATFSSKNISSFEIYDLMGTIIIRGKNNKVDMSNLNPGVYFVVGYDKMKLPLYKGKVIKK